MRIIAGEFRGRKLLAPESDTTRPITDRAKQSLFDILSPLLEGAKVYDCFSGTGSMGLECLSRGSQRALFFDADRSALDLLKKNIDALKVMERCEIHRGDLFKWFEQTSAPARKADLIFLDPPYRFLNEKPDELKTLASQMAEKHLTPGGFILFRHDKADVLELPGLQVADLRDYGSMRVELLQRI